jgi:hypothetical protein
MNKLKHEEAFFYPLKRVKKNISFFRDFRIVYHFVLFRFEEPIYPMKSQLISYLFLSQLVKLTNETQEPFFFAYNTACVLR